MPKILFTALLLWISGYATAQNCNLQISGTVTDLGSGDKLEFVTVSIVETQQQDFTRSDGTYTLAGLCPGTYTMVFKHLGCEDVVLTHTIKDSSTLDIAMPHKLRQIKQVDVLADKDHQSDQASMVSVTTVKLVPLLGGSLGDIVKNSPGITVLQTGATIAKPVINGFSGNRIVIMNNGVRLEGQQWGGEHAPEIDPSISNHIEIYYGAKAVRLGPDAIGGVISLNPAALPYGKKIGGNTNLAFNTNNFMGAASAQLESGIGKYWAWRVQGTYRKGANVFTPRYGLANTAFREGDFSAALGFKKARWRVEAFMSRFDTKIGIFQGAHIGNLTDLQQAINSSIPFYTTNSRSYSFNRPFQDVVHYTGKLNARYAINETDKFTLQYAVQYNQRAEYDKDKPLNDSLAALNLPEFMFKLTTHTVDAAYEHTADNFTLTAGLSGMQQSNIWDGRYFIPNFRSFNTGAFAIAEYRVNNWVFEAGARYDIRFLEIFRLKSGKVISPNYRFQNPSASLSIMHKDLLPGLKLGSWMGVAWRPPTVSELYSNGLHHGAASYEIGDTTFRAEVGYNANAFIYYEGKGVEFRAMLNYTYFDNYINLEPLFPATLTISGAFPTFKYRQVQASYTAINLSLAVDITKHLNLFTRNSMLWAYNYTATTFLLNAPPHRFQLGARYEFKDKGWFEKPYIEVVGSHTVQQYLVPQNTDYAPPPPAYTLLNAEAGFTAHIRNTHFTITLAASNLLNIRYRDYLDRFRYYTDAMGRNFSIKLHIPFGSMEY